MKKLNLNKIVLLGLGLLLSFTTLKAQEEEQEKPDVPEQIVKLRYFNQSNSLQWLQVESQLKTGKKIEKRQNASLRIYLDSLSDEHLMAKVNTGKFGKAKVIIPPSLKETWDANSIHEFIVIEEPSAKEGEETSYSLEIQKAKLLIDTSSDGETRSITATITKLENGEWVPAPDVEMKVGVERFGGILTGGDEDTYTTDSSGTVTLEFTKKDIPGNEKGDIMLVAKVEENEYFGNLLVKTETPWGVATPVDKGFFAQRTLWAKSSRAPYWLMFLAYGIILGVWATLIYLVFQLLKVIRMGKAVRV